MALTHDIQRLLMNWVKGTYDVVLPNFFYGYNECDLFRVSQSDFVFEYEIKISRSDFLADFKKENKDGLKHDTLRTGDGKYCPNRFFYVTPKGLLQVNEIPKYAGLLEFDGSPFFKVKKNAPLLHKNKVGFEVFRDICRTLSARDEEQRKRIRKIRNTDFDKEMAAMKREVEKYKSLNREATNELFLLKSKLRRQTA